MLGGGYGEHCGMGGFGGFGVWGWIFGGRMGGCGVWGGLIGGYEQFWGEKLIFGVKTPIFGVGIRSHVGTQR